MNLDVESLKIGGIKYQIQIVDKLQDDGETVWGCVHFKESTIYIDSELNDQKRKQVIMHEAVHACLHEAGIDDECNNEQLVSPLANIFYEFVNDNN